MTRSRTPVILLGLGFVVAGIDKLFGLRSYERLFRHLGWSEDGMRLVGAGEVAGGVMLTTPATRTLGGLLLAGTSAIVLRTELGHREPRLALPRFALLLAALAVTATPRR